MVNIRAKIKTAQNFFQTYILHSMEDFDHQSTESGALIGSNDDLLTEILLRLPLTSILRFKSVSKRWRWLLSQRPFTLLYDSLSKSHGLFVQNLYISFDVENQQTPFHFFSDPCGITVMQSCNGLLLCCNHGGKKNTHKYYVLNLTTKQYAIIPSVPGGQDVRKTICFMGLAFHQTHCVHYKIVCVRRIEPDVDLFQIQIYSSNTGKWKISIASFYAHHHTFDRGVYWNGAIHWASSFRKHFYFKIDVEQLKMLSLPVTSTVSSVTWTYYFGESRGHFHLIESPHPKNPLQVNVYEMLNDYSGWFVKYQVQLDELLGSFPEIIAPMGYAFYLVDVVKGEKEEDTFMVLVIPGKMVTYNLHDKSFKHISFVGITNFHHYIAKL